MNPILFSAAKGAERTMLAQHVRANNLSHADTVGFKALMEHSTPMRLEGSGFLTSVTSRTNSSINNFAQGEDIRTERPLDIAINGDGFITLEGLEDEPAQLFTRAGNFRLDGNGQLYLGERRVMSTEGPMVLPDFEFVSVSSNGLVSITPIGGEASLEVGALKLVKPENEQMTMHASGHFVPKGGQALAEDFTVQVRSGYLEASNVSSLEELVSIMSLTRQYEMQIEVMASADEIAQIGNKLLKA
ncbi:MULTISPECIES: flagellar hook-basal body complex protein [Vibrio]|uniref:Flagellar basal-body rod protein FlgF n=2 Tax=Vibrio coralliirubri TaxID=1516159 RepID=A0AA86WZS7_9VIBR|nr:MULTISPECIES: flagellar hook-basal body complex protein [Vibrio]CAH6845224.1 Flagellar basal-body rod protein flgF [Vibrio chagasii]MCK8070510.1 flagellar hook-basal body complex protein [Vibrio sp. 1CM23M]MCK8075204.1 flagellar hook-basal body complex protein [Vibrio sp. 1CM2L]MCK8081096.1 flagellar hook-basal body complex protein [Vibrio sp. 1CM24A]MCK8084335.1 flagellar hook-basal body complex protein [Vibrio sp. 1CM8B]|eukprot:TRINITY_DN18_c0_g1_i7.p1 TRINITY_DN18_c0_g1~~TRINITY_DN18_c0_g1_i7.p1  ORF type:complete len:245 (-),score=51.47 TRINITY_DN18_c0_g1_i7:589-1323(-)